MPGYDLGSQGDRVVSGIFPGMSTNPNPPPNGDVQGASTTDWGTLWNQAWLAGYSNSTGANPYSGQVGGGYDIGQGYTLGQQKFIQDKASRTTAPTAPPPPEAPNNDALLAEIDNIYNETMGVAGQREATALKQQESMIGDVEKQYAGNQKSLQTEKAAGQRDITASETTAGQTKENALAAGRRLYNELQMGGQQKFGGSSSAGQAYSELTGREFQRGQATTQQAFQNAMTKIMDMKQTLQERFDSAMNNLMIQKDTAIQEVRRSFQSKLDEINSLRAEAGINKSTQRLELLQNLRNNIYQINLASAQTQAQLALQKQQQEAENNRLTELLQAQASGLTQNQNALSSTATSNPTTSLAMTQGGLGATQPYTGRIKKDEETVTGVRRPEELFA